MAPPGIALKQCWNALGIDNRGRVYVGISSLRDDGRRVYVSTVNGQLYEFETENGKFRDLGYMLPADDYEAGRRIRYQ